MAYDGWSSKGPFGLWSDLEDERYVLRMAEKKHENSGDTVEIPDEFLTPHAGLLHKRDMCLLFNPLLFEFHSVCSWA